MAGSSFAPWSSSKISVVDSCTLRFHFKYRLRDKGAPIARSEGRMGAAIHEFLELRLRGEAMDVAFRKAAVGNKLVHNEVLALAAARESTDRFMRRFSAWCAKKGVTKDRVFIEKDVMITHAYEAASDYWGKDVLYRGKWDIGVVIPSAEGPVVVIIDHKTGERRETQKYQDQLWSYIASAYYTYPDLQGAQGALHWLDEDDAKESIQWGKYFSRERIEGLVLPWFVRQLQGAETRTQEPPVPTSSWMCNFCEYRHKCPLYK